MKMPPTTMRNGDGSFYLHDIGNLAPTRTRLDGDVDTDVCIVGGGYTGLWTAYWLKRLSPETSVTVLEANRVGFGASGRNLGWLSGKMVGHPARLAGTPAGRAGVVALRRACIEAIPEILSIMARHGMDVDAAHGGYLQVARTTAGLERIRAIVADRESWGFSEADLSFLGRDEVLDRIALAGARGGLYSPHCVRIQPAKLVTGLGRIVDGDGATIYEGTTATTLAPRQVTTPHGTVHARAVLRATEAYTAQLRGHRKAILPMRSSVVVSEPLDEADWAAIGWAGNEGVYGAEHASFFSLRTADGRIVLAGRGRPYHYGSGLDIDGELDRPTIERLQATLHELFPQVSARIAHAWCGAFGVSRDWSPSVTFDQVTGMGHAGGYAGQGVTAAYLAGRTLADLVLGNDSPYTALPWTNRPVPRWEPEPIRFAGAYTTYGLYRLADALERHSTSVKTSLAARLAHTLSGRP